ncbi:MAG TPA: hypothetical protein PLR99_20925, partial [Polyangiaceae bacterium]|nr:hypothetical protein [Polyangiaceae bacterium]
MGSLDHALELELADPESERLHARAQAFVRAFLEGRARPEPFDALAVDLGRFQASRVPGLARLGRARGVDLARVTRADELPAVPTDAFRHMHLATFPREAAAATFRTSGTTSGARGAHAMRHTRTYDAGAVAFGRHALFAGLDAPPHAIVLAPPPAAAPDSSLGHMLARFVAELCAPLGGEEAYFLGAPREGAPVEVAVDALEARVPIVPVAHAGAHETLRVLTDGHRFARAVGLQRFARAEIFPVHLSLPWGLAIGPWPHIPLPTTLRYRFGE